MRQVDERGPVERDSGEEALLGPRLVAAVLISFAALMIFQATGIRRGGGFSVVGPQTFPLAVSIGLLVLGVAFAVRTTLRVDHDLARRAADEERFTHWPTVGILLGLLVVYAVALNGVRLGDLRTPGLGYIVATTLFLPATARALGSTHLVRDVIVGAVLATAIYFGFTEFLGVRLPAGILDFVLP